MNARARVIISGYVQGVCFRYATAREARRLGLRGWVQNTIDRKVETVFEGDKLDIEYMVKWCREGPPHARVKSAIVDWEDYRNEFTDFRIR